MVDCSDDDIIWGHRDHLRTANKLFGTTRWAPMIRGIALDFDAAHRALIDAGFSIEKNVIECDCYVKKEQKVITAQDETLVVWTLTCDSRSDDVLFDDYEGLLDYLTAQVESRSLGEEIRFSITVSRMTRRQYDELPEFDL